MPTGATYRLGVDGPDADDACLAYAIFYFVKYRFLPSIGTVEVPANTGCANANGTARNGGHQFVGQQVFSTSNAGGKNDTLG